MGTDRYFEEKYKDEEDARKWRAHTAELAKEAGSVPVATPAGLGAQTFEQALATTIEPPPRETSSLPVIRAESFRYDPADGDVMVKISPGGRSLEVAIDDPLALLAVTMAAIKFGHGHEMLAAAMKLVADFGKEPTR